MQFSTKAVFIVVIGISSFAGHAYSADDTPEPASPLQPISDVAGLPRVLLIGDSISIGYTLPTRTLLAGKANVHRIPQNGSSTGYGLSQLDKWLGGGRWDVIHFNFGLHDAKLPPEGVRHAPLDVYEKNLRELVARMKATGAKLIWATTTPVPKGGNLAPNRRFGSLEQYNRIAEKVMRESDVRINDLNAAIKPHLANVGRSNDVHFSEAGYKILAKYVATAIETELPQEAHGKTAQADARWKLDESFYVTPYGRTPNHWFDALGHRPSRAWIVDGNGQLRQVLKNQTGLIIYRGLEAEFGEPILLSDAKLTAEFKKTEDETAALAVVGRAVDASNYYMARFRGTDRLELLIVQDGVARPLDYVKPVVDVQTRATGMIALNRYREGQLWQLSLDMQGDLITAAVHDERGSEMARISVRDTQFTVGQFGLSSTRFCAVSAFRAEGERVKPKTEAATESNKLQQLRVAEQVDYPILKPYWNIERANTRFDLLADQYDVLIAGAGTGGTAAALQAARLGAKVLLLEETDWIGGQMSCAGVTTMDEDGGYGKSPVRERGFYREFNESMVAYYQTLDKDPFMTYYSYPHQVEGGYEPKATRAVLYGFIDDVRRQASVLDVSLRTRVKKVIRTGPTVHGATIEFASANGPRQRNVSCKILIDATEYGDVIPLAGALYRSGNRTSDQIDPAALVQDHTWLAIAREYPQGIPDHLRIKEPPPGYEAMQRRFAGKTDSGALIWGAQFKGIKGPRHWRTYFAWRGSADADSQLTGERSVERHTQCGFNGGNDYPVTAATLEDPAQRAIDERIGIYKTLGTLYYFQHELGVNWSLAEDEGYATEYNRAKMKSLGLRPDLEAIAVHLPQQPYVRESRRIVGASTLRASDLTRYEQAKHFSNSVSMGDYFMDLDHGKTAHEVESGLDSGELPRGGGPFQVPMEVFIPESLDGFLAAEKNISQSRLANGATRLQPVTMLTGQAAGAIAALSVRHGVQPRQLPARVVQIALLDAGSTLIQRWHSDVAWGTNLWRATQLLSLYKILDREGPLSKDAQRLAAGNPWGVDEPLERKELSSAIKRLAELSNLRAPHTSDDGRSSVSIDSLRSTLVAINPAWAVSVDRFPPRDPKHVTAGEFALIVADVLKQH